MRKINVSIVYAEKSQQWLKELSVLRGTSAGELVDMTGVLSEVDALKGLSIESLSLGIYSQKTSVDHLLEEGDRLEIYRPLTADPKEVRRQLALMGKTMGKR